MKIRIQVVIEHDDQTSETIIEEIGCLQRGSPRPETLGLTLDEGKVLLGGIQQEMVKQQIAEYIDHHSVCQDCGQSYRRNGVLATSLIRLVRSRNPDCRSSPIGLPNCTIQV